MDKKINKKTILYSRISLYKLLRQQKTEAVQKLLLTLEKLKIYENEIINKSVKSV